VGTAAPGVGQKPCDLCAQCVDLLVRCQVRSCTASAYAYNNA
jgi:hypothetical protein